MSRWGVVLGAGEWGEIAARCARGLEVGAVGGSGECVEPKVAEGDAGDCYPVLGFWETREGEVLEVCGICEPISHVVRSHSFGRRIEGAVE